MDSPTATPGSLPSSNDENPRVKFLCSFSGSILPRPQDGKLRYVGGETRIVSVPRDISYEELMAKMRELYDGAAVLKYQQPDEDLDALVSVVNDDDVTNMMEEYDKVGSGDGFTRLRIFLFSNPDQDGSSHFGDGAERDTERRYVDALNSLNESTDFRMQLASESMADDMHAAEQYLNQISLESSLHNQRNYDIPMSQFNLRQLTIPHMGTGQHQQMEPPWSPAYYSPRHPGNHDPRTAVEFPTSPSSARHHAPYGEFLDKGLDRMPEEYGRQQINRQSPYDNQPHFSDNEVWLPTGATPVDRSGFPGNILHGNPAVYDGNSICEHCRVTFQRNQQYHDSSWKHGEPHLELPNNGFHQVASPCAECLPNRETFVLNTDPKFHHGFHPREQNYPRPIYNETHNHERGWILQPQAIPRPDEPRSHVPVSVRLNDHYIVDGIPITPDSISEGLHHVAPNYVHPEDPRYVRSGAQLGTEVFHDQAFVSGSHIHHIPSVDDRGARHGNLPYGYGADNHYHVPNVHAPAPGHTLWRHAHHPIQAGPSYEVSASPQLANGMVTAGSVRGTLDASPRLCIGADNQNPWVESSHKMAGFDGAAVPGNSYGNALKLNPYAYTQENQHPLSAENVQFPTDVLNLATPTEIVQLLGSPSNFVNGNLVSLPSSGPDLRNDLHVIESATVVEKGTSGEGKETNHADEIKDCKTQSTSVLEKNKNVDVVLPPESILSNGLRPSENCGDIVKPDENGSCAPLEDKELSDRLSFLPELIASVKKAALEGVEDVKARVQEDANPPENEMDPADVHGDLELDSDNDNPNNSKIEPSKAEAEAIARGLQTIKNDDVEEIRELGSGTYGAVYYGKWKGSDVAIKRIKASCFAGRPSERERLIADFWKEALILSSLHHPNVVSFYGIVRDGPDGSLATVTEFMVNGSLKQFLRKKDRTIDRRKRLIIAMDAAFGMEYLHAKNIVHFDLKCENLLVNMRDPHRPVCKIGDLGLSKVKQHTLVSGGVRGTLPWMAPELLSGKSNMVTEKIDVYSFGIVMWELLTGDEPYTDLHCASIIGGIVNNSLRPEIPTWCDPEWKALMESCWASDPAERPSFSEISQRLRNMAAAINVK
ncbi:uncharacterized protein LOC131335549 [Rhododendron vialii]|uniref:uncharacterized protein LOC131335549 n=1 Tax=Rhododendron vialii TaxID=182163 RepID=UPI00265E3C7A|nr:uncharacterized protein LOC131335549 [Rhododendron vialii]